MGNFITIVITQLYLSDKVSGLTLSEIVELFNSIYDKVVELQSKYEN